MKKIKLFCYPWSGGNGALFFKYSKLLGENFEVVPADIEIDENKSFKENIVIAAEKVIDQLENSDKLILFGHSMGAVVSFEVAKVLADRINSDRMGLVISGMLPPTRELLGQLDSNLTCESAKKYSSELGMGNLDMLPDSFLNAVIEKMNKDNRFLKGYESCGNPKLSSHAAILYSEQELEMGNPEAWSEMFDGNVEYITVTGKHFYLTEDFTPVSDAIKNIEKELMKGR